MKAKLLLLVFLTPFIFYAQTQIGSDIDGEEAKDYSGNSVSLCSDGNIVAIVAPYNDGNGSASGHVRVYQNNAGVWTQIGDDIDSEGIDNCGTSVSLSSDGNIIAIGGPYNNGSGHFSGHVRVYENISSVWTKIGADIDGETEDDHSGSRVSLSDDGTIVAIGAYYNNGNGIESGHVRVYKNVSGTWTKIGGDLDGEAAYDWSGYSISLSADGSIVAIGARQNSDAGYHRGHVRVYQNNSGVWTQIGTDIDGEAEYDDSGTSVSLSFDGNIVAIGAPNNSNSSGHVRVYQNISGDWTLIGTDIDGESTFSYSGFSVSLSSDAKTVAIGTYGGGVNYSGHVRVYDLSAVVLSVEDNFVTDNFTVNPNHSSSIFEVQLTNNLELKSISLYNYLGQKVIQTKETTINVSNLSSGLYYLEVETFKGKGVKKVLVE